MVTLTSPRYESVPAVNRASDELALIDVGGRPFALPLASVVAVLDPASIELAVAPTGAWIGSFATHGRRIPVADARLVFDLPMDAPVTRIVVLRGREPFALAVDDQLGTLQPGPDDTFALSPLCGRSASTLIGATVWNGPDLVPCIAVDWLEQWLRDPVANEAMPPEEAALTDDLAPHDAPSALLVEVGGETLALPVTWVRHVADDRAPVQLPRLDPAVTGLLAWERLPLPVIDVAALRAQPPGKQAMLIVIGAPARTGRSLGPPLAVLRVGAVTGVVPVSAWRPGVAALAGGRECPLLDLSRMPAAI